MLWCACVSLQELRGLGMTATNEEPEWKVAALGKVRANHQTPRPLTLHLFLHSQALLTVSGWRHCMCM